MPFSQNGYRTVKVPEEHVLFLSPENVPRAMTTVEIPKTTVKNNTFSQIARALKSDHSTSHALWNSPALKSFQHVQAELLVSPHGLILRNTKLVIPTRLQGHVVKLAHKGYMGIIKTKQLLCMCMLFSQMDKLFEGHVRNCIPCQAMSPKSSRDPTQPTPLHYGPWKNLAIDFGRPFPNWRYLLILMDKYSCFPVVEAVSTTNGLSVMPALKTIFAQFDPRKLKSDNGPPFNSNKFTRFAEELVFTHHRVTTIWPKANGETERFAQMVTRAIKMHVQGKD